MHVKCSANDVNRFGLRDLFNNHTGRTLWRLLMQEGGNGIQSKEAPIDALDPAFWLHTHTVGLKGGGVVGRNFLAHSERYSLALGQHLASVALATGA